MVAVIVAGCTKRTNRGQVNGVREEAKADRSGKRSLASAVVGAGSGALSPGDGREPADPPDILLMPSAHMTIQGSTVRRSGAIPATTSQFHLKTRPRPSAVKPSMSSPRRLPGMERIALVAAHMAKFGTEPLAGVMDNSAIVATPNDWRRGIVEASHLGDAELRTPRCHRPTQGVCGAVSKTDG